MNCKPARGKAENFFNYCRRRKATNKAIKARRHGILAHLSAAIVKLPMPGVDLEADAAVQRGLYRRIGPPVLLRGTDFFVRLAVTKGTTFSGGLTLAQKLEARAHRG